MFSPFPARCALVAALILFAGTVTAAWAQPVNTAPDAVDDVAGAGGRFQISIPVLKNDRDPDGDPITISGFTQGASGRVSPNLSPVAGMVLVYTPDPGFPGADQFTYTISDGRGGADTATVFIESQNRAPVALDDPDTGPYFTVFQDTEQSLRVLENDYDPEGDFLGITGLTPPAHGTVRIYPFSIPYLIYTPAPGYVGPDTFTYTASDGSGGADTATVRVLVVSPRPEITEIRPDSVFAGHPTFTLTVLGRVGLQPPDFSPRGFTPDSRVRLGDTELETIHESATRLRAVVPAALLTEPGTQSVTVRTPLAPGLDLGFWDSNALPFTLTGPTANRAPDAVDDVAGLRPDLPFQPPALFSIHALRNDTDPDGDPLTIIDIGEPQSRSAFVERTPDNTFRYFYFGDLATFTGDRFTYTVSDGRGGVDTATVIINARNNPPFAVDDVAGVNPARGNVTIRVLRNDYDNDGDGLFVQSVTQPAHGSVLFDPLSVVYIPGPDFTGSDSFTYTIVDFFGETATATVTIEPGNHPPVAGDDPQGSGSFSPDVQVFRGFGQALNVWTNDYDPDDDPLTLVPTQPAHGTVEIIEGEFGLPDLRYTPEAGYIGPDALTYTLSDGRGGVDTASVRILVINPLPEITTISPERIVGNGSAVPLTVNGTSGPGQGSPTGFAPESRVFLGGTELATTYVSPTRLQALVPDFLLTLPGTFDVQVRTPLLPDNSAGTWFSNTVPLTILEAPRNNPPVARDDATTTDPGTSVDIPVLENDTDPDGDPLTLAGVSTTFGGTAEIVGSSVRYTPDPGRFGYQETFTYTVTDGRGGTGTGVVTVAVSSPVPVLTSLNPSTVRAGGALFFLEVNGTGFTFGSTVQWNGESRQTFYFGSTQLLAIIPETDIAAQGTASVTVVTPAPGGGVSNALPFEIGPPGQPRLKLQQSSFSVFRDFATGDLLVNVRLVNNGNGPATNTRITRAKLGAFTGTSAAGPIEPFTLHASAESTLTLRFPAGAAAPLTRPFVSLDVVSDQQSITGSVRVGPVPEP